MRDFSVITRFGFRSLCDNGIRSKLVPFHFGWRILSCCPWEKRFLDCVWVRLLPMGLRDHMQERSYLTNSLCYPWGERKILRVWLRLLLPMGPRDHMQERSYLTNSLCYPWGREKPWGYGWGYCPWAKSLHTKEDNIMPVVNVWIPWPVYVVVWYICDKLPYVRFYGFGNYIVGAHKL